MELACKIALASRYKSASQIARVLTEDWCCREMYCPACTSNCLKASNANTPAVDYRCPKCDQPFQLKSQRLWNEKKIVDSGYRAMVDAIRNNSTPNLLVLQYGIGWTVQNLMLVPRFFFSEDFIERRKPLSASARRAGWIGCNILLTAIPPEGKIRIVDAGRVTPRAKVRQQFQSVRPLESLTSRTRGWTLDVLSLIRRLDKPVFSLSELYDFERELQAVHPFNRNVRPKIRQQLQVLRDLGLIKFLTAGRYAALKVDETGTSA